MRPLHLCVRPDSKKAASKNTHNSTNRRAQILKPTTGRTNGPFTRTLPQLKKGTRVIENLDSVTRYRTIFRMPKLRPHLQVHFLN